MSAYELLMLSDMKELLNRVRTLQDRVVLGMIMTKLFANPFSLHDHKGLVYIEDRNTFVYCFLCPIIHNRRLYIEKKKLWEICIEFERDIERIYGVDTDNGISEKFETALLDWIRGHLDRVALEDVELVRSLELDI